MVFVAAGMGGGTGTGAAPVIARTARERGILTIAVVTKPFHFEGQRRMQLAETGVQELRKHVDTLIVIPNQNLFRVANERTTFAEAFQLADQVLYSGVRGVTDLMVMPGLINLDFADVRTVMAEMGTAMMGTGEAGGPNRALEAAHGAMANPLLDIVSMRGAKGVLINITGGFDMTLYEVDQAANEIRAEVDANANIILGSTFDETLEGRMRVAVVATGIDDEAIVTQQTVVEPARRAAEATPRRPVVPPRAEVAARAAPQPVRSRRTKSRVRASPTTSSPSRRAAQSGGGFSMFGWKKPEAARRRAARRVQSRRRHRRARAAAAHARRARARSRARRRAGNPGLPAPADEPALIERRRPRRPAPVHAGEDAGAPYCSSVMPRVRIDSWRRYCCSVGVRLAPALDFPDRARPDPPPECPPKRARLARKSATRGNEWRRCGSAASSATRIDRTVRSGSNPRHVTALTRSVISPYSVCTGVGSGVRSISMAQPGFGCGRAVLMPSGISTRKAIVGLSAATVRHPKLADIIRIRLRLSRSQDDMRRGRRLHEQGERARQQQQTSHHHPPQNLLLKPTNTARPSPG